MRLRILTIVKWVTPKWLRKIALEMVDAANQWLDEIKESETKWFS